MVNELQMVQHAFNTRFGESYGRGYLSAFPFEHFERLQALVPVWAPFYVVRSPCMCRLNCKMPRFTL